VTEPRPVFRDTFWWHTKLNLLWLAQSWKWFILLGSILPGQVEAHVDGGQKNTAWGLILAGGALWASMGPVLFGSWSDRVGRRRPFIIWGTVFTAISLMALSVSNNLVTLAIGFFFLQVSDDIVQGAYSSLLPLIVPKDHQGRSSAILAALNQSAQIFGAVSTMVIAAFWGDRVMFGLNSLQAIYASMALANIVCLFAVLSAVKDLKEPFAAKVGKLETTFSVIRDLRKSGDFMWVWLSRLLVTMGYWLIQPYLLYFLSDAVAKQTPDGLKVSAFGMSVSDKNSVYYLALLISFAAAFTALILNKKLDRMGVKKSMLVSGWIMAGLLIPFAFMRDFSAILILGAIFGVGYGLYLSASWALAAEVMPSKEDLGRDMGLWQSATTIPQISPAITGIIVGSLNAVGIASFHGPTGKGILGYMVGILGAAVLMVVGCQLVRKVQTVR
jgi:MFS family permease